MHILSDDANSHNILGVKNILHILIVDNFLLDLYG